MSDSSLLRIVIVGHVDHGKSTLVGRLLNDTGSLPDGKVEALREVCERRGMPFEWAFVVDALQAERDQGITIDVAHIGFRSAQRPYVILDAPGHKEFLKNMITGAASADAALLVIDAAEGVREQSRRHGYLLHLLGLDQIAVAINKMDAVGWSQARFDEVAAEFRTYLASIGVTARAMVPVSARGGDNLAGRSSNTPWYPGVTVMEALDSFAPKAEEVELPLRLPVQDVYKFDHRRIVAGRIESGRLRVGDRLVFNPSGKSARIATIESWNNPVPAITAVAGQSVGITLDEPIFIERGQIASHAEGGPAATDRIRARLFWLGREPLVTGRSYKLKLATADHLVQVERIDSVIDVGELAPLPTDKVERNGVAELVLRARSQVALDAFADNPRTGRFVVVDGYDIVGGGIVSTDGLRSVAARTVKGTNLTAVGHRVTLAERWHANRHRGGVVWLTGLSGAGKSSIAMEVERRLFDRGWQVFVLDGDNIRLGLNSDLGFGTADRTENIRRIGEVANLFAQAGILVITAFISPYRADREKARAIAPDRFHEVYIKAGLAACEKRDPKGLYAKARKGLIPTFTGITDPYEPPEHPELVIDTEGLPLEEAVEQLMRYIERETQRSTRDGPTALPDAVI